MRIALQNPFPNRPHIAEAEWTRRFFTACDRLGFEPIDVVTSGDIMRCRPDCVLVAHEFSPKLTPFPTLGLNWNPPIFFAGDPVRRRCVLSLDGHLCGSRQIAQWIDDFLTGNGKRAAIYDNIVLPSCPDSGSAGALPAELAIMYAGVHWDGSRHGSIFRGLDERVPLKLYGPPEAWSDRGEAYRGALPFDGVSVIRAIKEAGIALCLQKAANREANCPSMRLFEAAAAGALIITDAFEFPNEWFRNSVLYVDGESPALTIANQIVSHVEWANHNREAAGRLARRSTELFRQSLTLENMLKDLPEFVDQVRERRNMLAVRKCPELPQPTVEYVMRIGSRSVATIARALESLAAQTYQKIGIILVQFHPVLGLDEQLDQYMSRFVSIRRIVVANNGNRSTCWWAGLNAVTSEFFGMLDDDDTIFPNHVGSIMRYFHENPNCGFVYSGLIKIEDDPGNYVKALRFEGPVGSVIEENRDLLCIEEETFEDLLPTRNVIGNNAWICRTSLLDDHVRRDPRIEWAEDVYFMALMAGRTKFGFTAMATAAWHWRSTTEDNWTLQHTEVTRLQSLASWQERLQSVRFPSHNKVPLPRDQYNVIDLVNRDLEPD